MHWCATSPVFSDHLLESFHRPTRVFVDPRPSGRHPRQRVLSTRSNRINKSEESTMFENLLISRPVMMALSACALLTLAPGAQAVDGVLEINQACAANTGCFTGDSAGFPVTITAWQPVERKY